MNKSWRIYPPAWRIGRRATEAIELDGYRFPAGTIILLHQWVTHNMPELWGDPEQFRPERWDPAHQQKLPQGAYFPFGGRASYLYWDAVCADGSAPVARDHFAAVLPTNSISPANCTASTSHPATT